MSVQTVLMALWKSLLVIGGLYALLLVTHQDQFVTNWLKHLPPNGLVLLFIGGIVLFLWRLQALIPLKVLFKACFIGTLLLTLLSYAGNENQFCELISHFRVQYLVLTLLSGVGLILTDSKKWLLPVLVVIGFVGYPIYGYYVPAAKPVQTNAAFRLMNVNVLKQNEHYVLLGKAIQKYQPDILALQEPDQAWLKALSPYLKSYPYQKLIPQDNNFGIALYSKIPVSHVEEKWFGKDYLGVKFPSILAELTWANRHFSVLVTHPLPPSGGFEVRNSQLLDIASQKAQWGENVIVTGDLNISQWSPFFQKFLKRSNLLDTQRGFGVQPSWMVDSVLFAIPIDHVLVSPKFRVINRQIGPDIGSDHRPVIVDLTLIP